MMNQVMIGSCSTAGRNLRTNSSSRAGKYLSTNCGANRSKKMKLKVLKLENMAFKQFPGSPKQKRTIKQIARYKKRIK